jgi:anti-sigma B factor antagonist
MLSRARRGVRGLQFRAQIGRIRARLGNFYFSPETVAMMLETEVFEVEPDITVVSCAGRFTLGTQLRLTESMINTLIQKGARKLVIDLTHTEILDSAGLGVLMHISGELELVGGTLHVAGASDRVANVFQVTHTDRLLTIDPDLASSVKKMKGTEA